MWTQHFSATIPKNFSYAILYIMNFILCSLYSYFIALFTEKIAEVLRGSLSHGVGASGFQQMGFNAVRTSKGCTSCWHGSLRGGYLHPSTSKVAKIRLNNRQKVRSHELYADWRIAPIIKSFLEPKTRNRERFYFPLVLFCELIW